MPQCTQSPYDSHSVAVDPSSVERICLVLARTRNLRVRLTAASKCVVFILKPDLSVQACLPTSMPSGEILVQEHTLDTTTFLTRIREEHAA